MKLDTSFSCYLMSVMTLNIFVLRKHRLISFNFATFYVQLMVSLF